ncbi:MAG: Hpt domain-containing protein, partial [Paracoccaceae bacterium]
EDVGAEDFDEVVDLFLDEVEGVMDRLRDSPEVKTLEEDLHFLKGSALSLGFKDFSALCQTGETNAAQGNADQIDLPEILACYDASKTIFMTDLPAQLAA